MSVKLTAEDNAVNDAVARIMGKSKSFFKDPDDSRVPLGEDIAVPSVYAAPSPLDDIRPKRIQESQKLQARGENAAFAMEIPTKQGKPAKDINSQGQATPNHKMPPKKGDDMYGVDDQDDVAEPVESIFYRKKSNMKSFVNEYIGDMESFNKFAGITPLYEDSHVARSGDVPTAGVNKDNKMKSGGLPGLEGQSLQAVDPEEGPAGKNEVGDDEYSTLDQAIAMLKKEGIDTDQLWADFLEARGISAELFSHLVDEAMETEDQDELDALIAVEGLFLDAIPKMLPEGTYTLVMKKKPADPNADMGKAGIMKHGMMADKPDMSSRMAAMRQPEAVPQVAAGNRLSTRMAKPTVRINRADLPASPRSPNGPPKIEAKEWSFHTHHDHETGGPCAPWDPKHPRNKKSKKMEYVGLDKFGVKYLGESKWMQKLKLKSGALRKELGVPAGKKIPAKKLNKAAKAGGLEGKRANLAKVFKKANHK